MANGSVNYLIGEAGFLLVKISKGMSRIGDKVFAVPEHVLAQFEIDAENVGDFERDLEDPKRVNVDFAIFKPDVTVRGSGG